MLQKKTRALVDEYKKARRETKTVCRERNKHFEENLILDLQETYGINESKKFFESVRNIKRGFQPRTNLCRDKKCNLVSGEQQVLERWTEYFKDLLCKSHEETIIDEKIYYGSEPFLFSPTANVVYDVIRKLKLNRAPGDDCINAELIKNGGKHLWKCIFDLILEIWNKEVMSADWKTAVICPIHKKRQ
jgi:hypothetical protein